MVTRAIEECLGFMHRDHLEVPFIAMYRKEHVTPLLRCRDEEWVEYREEGKPPPPGKVQRWELLWAVHDWDRRYMLLEKRRE